MKIIKTALIIFEFLLLLSCTNDKIIELPLTVKKGYGPFETGLRGLPTYRKDPNREMTCLEISGIPENWTDVKMGDIETNVYQAVYQNYLLGNISKEKYESLQKAWRWEPDTVNLSKKPVKCKIAFAFGRDTTGELKMIVDTNNNYNLSDDDIFSPTEINGEKWGNIDSMALGNSINITYERFLENKIAKESAQLFIVHDSESGRFMYNFPQYAVAEINGRKIGICSDYFANLSYNNPGIVLLNDSIKEGDKVHYNSILSKNEYLEVKNKLYKIIRVNLNRNALIIKKTNLPKNQLYSTQVGFKSFRFEGSDFKTKTSVSLNDLKGKYVLLDFWSVFCGPCIHEIPNMKGLYEKIDKTRFEIVGIVGDSPPDVLEKIINEKAITWPQILSDDTNKIKEKYGISMYPTNFLLDTEGTIIAKNIRGKELENKILNLLNKKLQ